MSPSAEARTLQRGASRLGVELNSTQTSLLIDYLEMLYAWNASAGLTSIARRDAVRLHLLDSLSAAPLLGGAADLVDLGSGAGLPGIPLAVAAGGLRVTLVESRRRKCSFLAEVVRELRLDQCTILEEDARVLAASGRCYDAVVARAFVGPAELVALACPLVRPGGRLLIMASDAAAVPASLRDAAAVDFREAARRSFELPDGGEARTVVALERSAEARN